MPERPHPTILNREKSRADSQNHLPRQTELLRDLANFGSNLVIRAFNSSPKKIAETVVCGVFLKQVVSMIDAAEVLLSEGCGHAAFLPARSAFEASIYLDWVLKSDSERRATCYLVANYREQREWASRVIPGTDEASIFKSITENIGFDIHTSRPELAIDAERHIAEIDRILKQPELEEIDNEFTQKRGRRKRDLDWYELDGLRTIREIADKVNRKAEYVFFYSKGSQVAHTGTYRDHIRFLDGQTKFLPVRHLSDINMLLNYLVTNGMHTFSSVLHAYRPAEVPAFFRKYVSDWRDPFIINAPKIKYNF